MKKHSLLLALLLVLSPSVLFAGKIKQIESEILMDKIDAEIHLLSQEIEEVKFMLESKQPAFIKTVFSNEEADYIYRAYGATGGKQVTFSNGYPLKVNYRKPFIKKIGNIELIHKRSRGSIVKFSFPFVHKDDKENLSVMVSSTRLGKADKNKIKKEIETTFRRFNQKVIKALKIADNLYKKSQPCKKRYSCRLEKNLWSIHGAGENEIVPGGFDLYGVRYEFEISEYSDRYDFNELLKSEAKKGNAIHKENSISFTDKSSGSKINFNLETGKGLWVNWKSLEIDKLARNKRGLSKNTGKIRNNLGLLFYKYKKARLNEFVKEIKKSRAVPLKEATF